MNRFEHTYDMENPATYHENVGLRRLELDTEMKMIVAAQGLNPAGDGHMGMGQNYNMNVSGHMTSSQTHANLLKRNAEFLWTNSDLWENGL